jgi:hypothetical protein
MIYKLQNVLAYRNICNEWRGDVELYLKYRHNGPEKWVKVLSVTDLSSIVPNFTEPTPEQVHPKNTKKRITVNVYNKKY